MQEAATQLEMRLKSAEVDEAEANARKANAEADKAEAEATQLKVGQALQGAHLADAANQIDEAEPPQGIAA
jgi:hypothetical protein